MAERVLRARFEGDASGLKRMAQEGKQAIDMVVDAQEKGSREMVTATAQAEAKMVSAVQSASQRRISFIQRETNDAIQAIEKLPIAREEKERQIARIVETNAKRTSEILIQEIRRQEQAHQQVSDGMGSQSEAAIALTRNIAGLVAAYVSLQSIIGMAGKGLAGNADLQQAGLTFEVLFKDADRAKAKIEELYSFAAKTPFEFAPVKDAALALETFGLNSSVYLRDAGDLAAAFGAEISEVARVFGRINSGDFGEAFERLRDFGISRELLEGEGLVFDKSGSYQGSVEQALAAVQNIIRTKFGGMMERQSGIFNGQMSNLADNFQTILNSTMAPTFDTLTGAVTELNTALDGAFGDEMQANIRVLGDIVNGVAVASLALGKAIGETLDEMMAPLRWLRDTAASLGRGAGERDVAKSLVLSSGINPNRAQHYANLVGRGENLQNIARDFRVNSWGDQKGVQEDLGRLAVIMADAKQIVAGTKQYQNFEPFGPPLPPGGTPPKDPRDSGAAKPMEGHQLFAAQHKAGFLSDDQYLAKLNVELGKVVKNSSDYFSILEKIKALETGAPSFALPAKTGNGYYFPGGGPDQFFGPGYGKDLVDFEGREAKRTEDLGARIEREATAYAKKQEQIRKENEKIAKDLGLEADKSLRSGLEAGVSAFLDGGLGNLGEATYSLSKDAFSKALVDGIMSGEMKDAFGGLGASLGAALQHPMTAAVAVAAVGVMQIKDAFDKIQVHNQKLADLRKKYSDSSFSDTDSARDLKQLTTERAAYEKEANRNPNLLEAMMGFGYTKAISREKLKTYDAMIPGVANKAFDESWKDRDAAVNASSLAEALAATEAAAWGFATSNGLSVEVSNQLIEAKKNEIKAAWSAAKALENFDKLENVASGFNRANEWIEQLTGEKTSDESISMGVYAATHGAVNLSDVDSMDAVELARLYKELIYGQNNGNPTGEAKYSVGMGLGPAPKSTREQIANIIGYDPGMAADEDGNQIDLLKPLLENVIMPALIEMRAGDQGQGSSQSIGSMSNPDHALQFDAPQTRNIVNNNSFSVHSQAFMGNRAEAREFAMMIWEEFRAIDGESV